MAKRTHEREHSLRGRGPQSASPLNLLSHFVKIVQLTLTAYFGPIYPRKRPSVRLGDPANSPRSMQPFLQEANRVSRIGRDHLLHEAQSRCIIVTARPRWISADLVDQNDGAQVWATDAGCVYPATLEESPLARLNSQLVE